VSGDFGGPKSRGKAYALQTGVAFLNLKDADVRAPCLARDITDAIEKGGTTAQELPIIDQSVAHLGPGVMHQRRENALGVASRVKRHKSPYGEGRYQPHNKNKGGWPQAAPGGPSRDEQWPSDLSDDGSPAADSGDRWASGIRAAIRFTKDTEQK
jgi:hypothetical protein